MAVTWQFSFYQWDTQAGSAGAVDLSVRGVTVFWSELLRMIGTSVLRCDLD